jgi:hypothetical protein
MRTCFTESTRIIAAVLACLLFAFLTGCSSTHVTPVPVVTAVSGGGQSTTVATAFAAPFVATVTINGQPATGVAVVFTAPADPGCTFANGTLDPNGVETETDVTDSTGTATSSICTADTVSGSYIAGAATLPAAGASFSLSNMSGPPATITAASGTPQSAEVDTAFADALVANVLDQYGNPVSGASVTFTAPGGPGAVHGGEPASGTFANESAQEVDTTDANGNATSSTFTANDATGTYNVTGVVTELDPVDFTLTNTPGDGVRKK